jgi:hypothetical protein
MAVQTRTSGTGILSPDQADKRDELIELLKERTGWRSNP